MNAKYFLLGFAVIALAGCQAPLVDLHAPSSQPKAEYVHDWDLLAKQAASKVSTWCKLPAQVYVAPGPSDMPFAQAFRPLLEQAITQRGYPVGEAPNQGAELSFEVQTFRYAGEQRFPIDQAPFSTLGAGAGIAAGVRHVSSVDTALAFGAVGPALDVIGALNDRTNAEVLLTLRVMDGTQVCYVDAHPFYVQWQDLPFYWTDSPGRTPVETASGASPEASQLAVISMPILGGR